MPQRIALIALIALIVLPLNSQQPNLPHNQAGRPGTFHFVTLEQAEKQNAELRRANESLMRLAGAVATVPDENMRQQMLGDIVTLSTFVRNIEDRQKPAGITAAEVEKQLNNAKGEVHCTTCHGNNSVHQEPVQAQR